MLIPHPHPQQTWSEQCFRPHWPCCVQAQVKMGKVAAADAPRLPEDDDTGEGLERKQPFKVGSVRPVCLPSCAVQPLHTSGALWH